MGQKKESEHKGIRLTNKDQGRTVRTKKLISPAQSSNWNQAARVLKGDPSKKRNSGGEQPQLHPKKTTDKSHKNQPS